MSLCERRIWNRDRNRVSVRVGEITVGSLYWGQLEVTLPQNMATALCLNLAHSTLALATPSPLFSGTPASSPVPAHDPFKWKTYFPAYSRNSYMQRYTWSHKCLPSKASLLSHYTFFCLLPKGFCTGGADRQMNHRIES